MQKRLWVAVVAALSLVSLTTCDEPETPSVPAAPLDARALLENFRGYLGVERLEEAERVMAALAKSTNEDGVLDQARFELARAFVDQDEGSKAIAQLEKIDLATRSFDFQRAVLRTRLQAVGTFFYNAAGDLRTPAQLEEYDYHSALNPDPEQRTKLPEAFEDTHQIIDYFDTLSAQLSDLLTVLDLPRESEPALAEAYDAIQIMIYGRGIIDYPELQKRLEASKSGDSPRTLYLLGNQHFAECDYIRAFQVWGKLLTDAPEDANALRGFRKTYRLFELRKRLQERLHLWPLEPPTWLQQHVEKEPFKAAAAAVNKELDEELNWEGIQAPTRVEVKRNRVEEIVPALGETEEDRLVLLNSSGWQLQTSFRAFRLERRDQMVLRPGEPVSLDLRTRYHGIATFRVRRFADCDQYLEYRTMEGQEAARLAASLPEVLVKPVDLGPLTKNGSETRQEVKIALPGEGLYLVTARARYVPIIATTQVAVVGAKILAWTAPDGAVMRVVDRTSGRPRAGVTLTGTATPAYDLAKIAPELQDAARSPRYMEGLRAGFEDGERNELLSDNDDFIAGFNAGLKLREQYPPGPRPISVTTDGHGLATWRVPDDLKGVSCRLDVSLDGFGRLCHLLATTRIPSEETEDVELFWAERPIAMPGETVRVKGILRRRGDLGLAMPEMDERDFHLWHKEDLVAAARAKPNDLGTVALAFDLPLEAPLGGYHVSCEGGDLYPIFRVDRLEKPLAEVRVALQSEHLVAGGTLRGQVSAALDSLLPGRDLPVRVLVYHKPDRAHPAVRDERNAFFSSVHLSKYPDGDQLMQSELRRKYMQQLWEIKGRTNEEGIYSFAVDTEQPGRFLIWAEVTSSPGRRELATAEALAHELPMQLQVTPERHYYYPGEDLKADVRILGLDGRPLSTSVRVEVKRRDDQNNEHVQTRRLETGENGLARLIVPIGKKKPEVRIGVDTSAGVRWYPVEFELRGIGRQNDNNGFSLTSDREAYYPGETARLTLEATQPGINVLLTIERERVRRTIPVAVKGTRAEIDVPLTRDDAPNVQVRATAVWDDQVHRVAVSLPVIPSHRLLRVSIETDRERYAGGEPVSARVVVRDAEGQPVPDAEISLAAVLASAFVLQEDLTPDLFRYLHNAMLPVLVRTGASIRAADRSRSMQYWLSPTWAWSKSRGAYGGRYGGGRRRATHGHGGSVATGMSDRSKGLYAEFLRQHGLTLFYEARLVTGPDGSAETSFMLPPDARSFRFTARAVDAKHFVGEIRQEVVVEQRAALQVPWPSLMREGERFMQPVYITNGTDGALRGTVRLESPLVPDATEHEVTVPARGRARVKYMLDCRKVPETLAEEGVLRPLSLAPARVRFVSGGIKTETREMIPIATKGIKVEHRTVLFADSERDASSAAFDLRPAMPGSAWVELRPLPDAESWIKWLHERLATRAASDAEAAQWLAWVDEANAPRLDPAEQQDGKSLLPDSGVLRMRETKAPYAPKLMTLLSARQRGVRLPVQPLDRIVTHCFKNPRLTPIDRWAFAASSEFAETIEPKAVELLRRRPQSVREAAYAALGFTELGRTANASTCLTKALEWAGIELRGGTTLLSLGDAAPLLLAAERTQADAETRGQIVASLLQAIASEGRNADNASLAVAIHALREWAKHAPPVEAGSAVRVDGQDVALDRDGTLDRALPVGRRVDIALPTEDGPGAVEVTVCYRTDQAQARQHGPSIRWQVARERKEGESVVSTGGELYMRVGETLLVTSKAEGAGLVTYPRLGPWPAQRLESCMSPRHPELRPYILAPGYHGRLAGALLDGDYDKVRQVLCKATMKSAFAERFALEATQFKASVEPWIHTRPDALIADGGDSRAWRLRPDRTGTFVLRSPYLFGEKGPVSAPPVKLHVLPADADLPLEVAPRDSTDAWTRKHVCSALAVIPDAYLAARLSRQWNDVDIYDLALHGLFASTSPEAPRLYAALAFKPVKPELDELDVTMAMVPRRSKSLPKADQLQTAVLKRALEGEGPFATLRHFIDSEVGRDKAGFIPGLAVECAKTENEWRVALLEHASGRADLDAIAVSRLETGRFFGSLPEETHARILDEVDTGGGIYRPRPHPFSLHALLAQWGRDWGLELEIGPKVPDLQADEYQLALPWLPQVRELNRRLSGSGLRARRDGRRVTIETMPAALVLRPELTEFYAAPDATKRLAWYLHGPTVSALDSAQGRASTFNIVVLMQGDASVDLGPGFRYCPRVSVPGDVDPGEVWEKLVKATRYPRLHDLRRIGLNYKVDDGVLRFEKQ